MESILILSANGSSKSAFARRTAQGSVFCKGDRLLQRGRSFVKGPVFCKGVGLLQRGWSFAKEPVFCKGVSLLQIGRSFAKGPVCCKWAGLLQSGGSVATIFLLLVWMLQIGRPLAWRTVQQFLFLNYPHHPDAPVSCKKNAQHDHFCANNLDHWDWLTLCKKYTLSFLFINFMSSSAKYNHQHHNRLFLPNKGNWSCLMVAIKSCRATFCRPCITISPTLPDYFFPQSPVSCPNNSPLIMYS